MTSIMLTVTGAVARASVTGPLTSGMVGIPVKIEYDDAWSELTKNLVCRCVPWGYEEGETRAILNVEHTATVAHEVMKAGMYLRLGIEGCSADGKLVIPTVWAECGKIHSGANANADPSSDPELPIWEQLQTEIEQIKGNAVTEAQIEAAVADYFEKNPVEDPDSGNCLPTDGKAGQVLTMGADGTAYWADPPAGGGAAMTVSPAMLSPGIDVVHGVTTTSMEIPDAE